ncbi:GMP/IMP nucleotidase [Thiolapillus sp.]|uniref:GMP/IMP nucleotidase n=1 Tax=Thiolapillus brandeum TaxID=1076588 RepID=A0A831RXX3_9GAMM|nr:GMP/IMP nucleotidase [Thiolapillus sp.]HEC07245.1 GMP/IMP nucleotidase [Thiolapillus brandeum]
MFDWAQIDTVLLDMDGTLLDLHFDNHFWLEYVPRRYAEQHGLSLEAATEELMQRYRRVEGTLDWYCVDYWSRELALDIPLLKTEVEHLIAVHPHVTDFLECLGTSGKSRVLVTNAHQKALQLKMGKTRLGAYLDQVISAHDIGLPKENPAFWERLQQVVHFSPERSLFIDDSLPVLRSARDFGIGNLLCMLQPDARQPAREISEFPALQHFEPLLQDLAC